MPAVIPGPAPLRTSTPKPKQHISPDGDHDEEAHALGGAPAPLPGRGGRRVNRLGPSDPLSDRMTEALIRRTLCPHQLGDKGRGDAAAKPIEELLPPLTSRNDVDLQLYAFLAIILRDFVQSWYSKITPDVTFIEETIQIVAHCTTALEQRFRKLDLESLLLDELPDLLDKHIKAYRTAHAPTAHPSLEVDPREVYHSLMPLPYLSPIPRSSDPTAISEQLANEAAYRELLVQGALAVLLPTEDLENPCLTALVGQIFSELVIGNVIANKAAQPWLLLEGICILARVLLEKKETATEKMTPSAHLSPGDPSPAKRRRRWSVHAFFLWLIQVIIFLVGSLRLIFTTLAMPSTLPARSALGEEKSHLGAAYQGTKKPSAKSTNFTFSKTPVLAFSGWSCLGNMIEMPIRMPWLSGFLSLLQDGAIKGPGQIAGLNSAIDRLLSHYIHVLFFSPPHLAPILRSLRGVLFPNNAPGSTTLFPPPSDAELHALRRRAASALLGLLPSSFNRLYFSGHLCKRSDGGNISPDSDGAGSGGQEENGRMVEDMEGLLMVVSDEYCNKHLMYSVLELILVRLMPELSKKGVEELWDERLG